MRCSWSLVLALSLLGCAPEETATPETVGVFGLDGTPVVLIGVSEGEPALEFHHAISARRLGDGRIIVANGGTRELRWFTPDGAFLRSAGGAGQGPGEFRGTPTLFPWPGDSIAAFDPSQERLSLFGADGSIGRTVASGPAVREEFPWFPWVHRRTVVLGTRSNADRACVVSALAVMPLPAAEDGMRFLHLDDAGRFWTRTGPANLAEWRVWARDGSELGRVAVPGDFDLLHVATDFVLGRQSAEDGTDRIVGYAITDGRHPGACLPAVSDSLPTVRPEHLTRQVRNLLTGQEMAYVTGGSYTTRPDSIPVAPEEGQLFWFFRADRRGWAGAILDRASEASCVMSVGNIVAGGWRDGAIVCG
jgi:hypothetical protein